MSPRSILLIAAALLLTVGTVMVARGWLQNQRSQVVREVAPPPEINKAMVLVAKVNLPVGVFLREGQLRWQAWPDEDLPETYMTQETVKENDLYGTVVRRSFSVGEPITQDRLVRPGPRGFLAAVLQAGYRAVSIPVSATSGIAGLVFPGDRVDIILTHTLETKLEEKKTYENRASETVLTNVRVLALDQKTNDQDGKPKLAKTATLEVTPKQAEILAVVRELGSLSLALRSIAKDDEEMDRLAATGETPEEPDPEKGKTYTWDSEASLLVAAPGEGEGPPPEFMTVSRGKEIEEIQIIGGSE